MRMGEVLNGALAKAGIAASALAGIGVGCAGPLDPARGILLESPNLGWSNAPVGRNLARAFDCPVHLVNDVDAGVYGEYRFGAARGSTSAVGIFPGTGIGGGAVISGEILSGPSRSGMEIGHVCVLPDGPLCGCGQRGCLEAVASRLSIASAAAAAAFRGAAPVLLANAGTDIVKIRSKAIAQSVQGGDRAVEEIVRDAARWVGVGVATLVNLLAPDCVILGGGLVEELGDLYVNEVKTTAERRVMTPFRKTFRIVTAKLGDDAVVQGAAAWAEHQGPRAQDN
jgi:glucokinase